MNADLDDHEGQPGEPRNIAQRLGAPETAEIEFELRTLALALKIPEFDGCASA